MKSSSTFMLVALLTSTLAGADTEPSTCITTKTLPAITIYSCPGDIEPTQTVFAPGQSPNSASQPGAPGSSPAPGVLGAPGATGQVDGPEEPNDTKHAGNPQQSNAPESPGSGSNSDSGQHVDGSQPSASEPGVVPGSPATPSVVPVAGAPTVHLDLLLLTAVGITSVGMVWF
ncbi:hypothetical protein CEP54_012699 [Fusarium duplospermum]|uniref:Uncharacterized protein n=1 Tax=Fusarium duplospermum TaxID=1325734 RepID=A0A428P725_9HYPO|nr:hypothetical protein CEP54_012699 [Fusarium duplospermum]